MGPAPDLTQARQIEKANMDWCDVSPDGRWVAFGVHTQQVNVYDAATGRGEWQSSADGHDYCRFSSNGRWLLTDNDGGRAYAVGTWKPGPRLGPGRPWDVSPDGRLVVVSQPDGVNRLVELATGRELAKLEDPARIAGPAVFTSDGTRLVVAVYEQANYEADGLRVWDLRRIRAELVNLGLDWDAPAYEQASPAPPDALEVSVIGAELIPQITPIELNNQAWRLARSPTNDRDVARALELVREALKQQPTNANFMNTIGLIHYRRKQYAEALAALEKSLAGTPGQADGYNLFVLAMCYAKLDLPDKGVDCFDRALRWLDGRKDMSAEQVKDLTALRGEAETVLGLR